MSVRELFCLLNACFLLGALVGPGLNRYPRASSLCSNVFTLLGSLCGLWLSLRILGGGETFAIKAPALIPWVEFSFFIDGLAAFFVLVVSILSFAFSLYSLDYNKEYYGRNVGLLGFGANLFLLSMVWVLSANDALAFLIFWELMTLVSYFLVVYEYEKEESVRAGLIYLIMAHVGSAFITVSFLVLYKLTSSFSFDDFRTASAGLPSNLKDIVFVSFFLGFGTKAGIIPLHIWLPRAHPAAPSSISALMSGVMIKTAIYGMARVIFDVLGVGSLWWGVLILVLACASAFLGMLYALMEHDLKRLLAYSSVENVGIILIGLGAAVVFKASGHPQAAVLSLMAGLFHVLNHAIFKGLLFFGSGAVLVSTHSKDIEELGGLIKKMPWTALSFLIGSISISALPPFNGFVSEWLMFQGLLLGFGLPETLLKVFMPVCAVVLVFSSALAGSCFVKAFGITFLGLARSAHATKAQEVPLMMRLGMGLLALLCLILGVFPQLVLSPLSMVSSSLLHGEAGLSLKGYGWLTLTPVKGSLSSISPSLVFVLLTAILVLTVIVLRVAFGKVVERIGETWGCGIPLLKPRMEYTATAFSKPFLIIFSSIYKPTEDVEVIASPVPEQPHFNRIKAYKGSIVHVFDKFIYEPLVEKIMRLSQRVQALQAGSLHLYLLYIFVTLIVLLFFTE
jgi:hydrogenase-4 component B